MMLLLTLIMKQNKEEDFINLRYVIRYRTWKTKEGENDLTVLFIKDPELKGGKIIVKNSLDNIDKQIKKTIGL